MTYSGRVQGVGFRYTAQSLATQYDIAGWVRNQADGTVELEAEGAADQVTAFLDALARHFGRNIDTINVRDGTPSGQHGFHVRRG